LITVNGKELPWQAGLTIQDLATALGGAPGTSFVSVGTPLTPAGAKPDSDKAPRPRLVSRMEWPDTQVPDGVTIKFIVIPSGG
jgi:sulfur carrier protein ThiS